MTHFRFRLQVLLGSLLVVVLLGSVGFAVVEDRSLGDALYFSLVTIATVGYGDIHPTTGAGKVISVIIILAGAGLFISFLGTAAEAFLSRREQQQRLEKLHVVMGVYFSEVGTQLLHLLGARDSDVGALRARLSGIASWDSAEFRRATLAAAEHPGALDIDRADLADIFALLSRNRDMLLRILENPTLQEHAAFTDLMRASFHLLEELSARPDFDSLPPSDVDHLTGDLRRVYRLLIPQWVEYLGYLQANYEYLFSLSVRTNPFDPAARAVVEG